MLIGSFLGDALGGPVEFQSREDLAPLGNAPHQWDASERLDDDALRATRNRLVLRGYDPLRPEPEPYGHWQRHAPPGTVTDDSRHKMVLLHALRGARREGAWPLEAKALARAYLDWPGESGMEENSETSELCATWLREWNLASRWVLGERDSAIARPPERLWGGLSTCCGQMTLLPIAAIHPGRPEEAYRHAYELAYFDNGPGLDLNAALVAGLAHLLGGSDRRGEASGSWDDVFGVMRAIDPHGYGEVPWVPRPVVQWLDRVEKLVESADGRPGILFREFDVLFADTIKWEAEVCFSMAVAAMILSRRDPLAALQLSLEWGHDTDSYAQVVGAFIGARHGDGIFPETMRETVIERCAADYRFDLAAEAEWLAEVGADSPGGRRGLTPRSGG